ncbi:MAG: hypothetical protein ACKVT0_07845 [Planctomycetaceae bacterium]
MAKVKDTMIAVMHVIVVGLMVREIRTPTGGVVASILAVVPKWRLADREDLHMVVDPHTMPVAAVTVALSLPDFMPGPGRVGTSVITSIVAPPGGGARIAVHVRIVEPDPRDTMSVEVTTSVTVSVADITRFLIAAVNTAIKVIIVAGPKVDVAVVMDIMAVGPKVDVAGIATAVANVADIAAESMVTTTAGPRVKRAIEMASIVAGPKADMAENTAIIVECPKVAAAGTVEANSDRGTEAGNPVQ